LPKFPLKEIVFQVLCPKGKDGIAKAIASTTAYLQHWADVEADWLMLIPFVTFVLTYWIITFLLGFAGLRLWAARRTRFTWVAVCASILAFPIGTVLGLASLIWLILLRTVANLAPGFRRACFFD
jgi:hypothetical protein